MPTDCTKSSKMNNTPTSGSAWNESQSQRAKQSPTFRGDGMGHKDNTRRRLRARQRQEDVQVIVVRAISDDPEVRQEKRQEQRDEHGELEIPLARRHGKTPSAGLASGELR